MEQTEKKRKGRPKKQEQTMGEVSQKIEKNEAQTRQAEQEAAQTENAEPQKRRRGRPRKIQTAAQDAAAEKTTKSAEKADAGEISKEKPAKPRGRKKKNTEAEKILAINAEDRKALAAPEDRKALAGPVDRKVLVSPAERKALTKSEVRELPYIAPNLPAESARKDIAVAGAKDIALIGGKDLALYEQGQVVPAAQNEGSPKKPVKITKKRAGKSKKESSASESKTLSESAGSVSPETLSSESVQDTLFKQERSKKTKEVAEFDAGINGIAEYNGAESLSSYGEQAGLGVFGVIDEAPDADAVLPLVSDTEVKPKTARKRGRRKKSVKDTPEQEFSPIVEDGDMARIQAEENVRSAKKSKKETAAEKQEHVRRVLYVSTVPDEQVEVVITENGVVSEYFVEMAHQSKIRGNIYKGIINNVDTNLQAAFVNFGCGKNGFLQIDEVHPEYYLVPHDDKSAKYPPIQKVLKAGQEILVQVVKEPNGSKGAFLTTWLSLAGRFLVLTPGQEQIGVSRKVEDNEERQRLRSLLGGIKPGENMGIIIRTASEGASKTHIHKDLQLLKRTWKNIQKQVVKSPAPSLVYQEADLATRAVRDYLTEDIDEVWVDSKDVQKSVGELIKVLFPKNKDILHLHDDKKQTLWEHFNITRQLDEVTKREVNLPSGGRLVFDQTEALMAIDINSGKSQGKNNFEAMVYRTNMEAVEAIARHLRLRDIGGQVVIDFIEMRDKAHCKDVENALHNAMKRDRARHDIGKLSSFGLLELVRQRTGSSVISISSEPCPYCRGTGFRRNLEWQAQGVLRDIRSKLAGKNVPSTYVHHVEQEIAFYLLNKKRDRLSDLEHEFNVRIEIHLK